MRAASFAFGLAWRQGSRLVAVFVVCHSALTGLIPTDAAAVEHDALVELHVEVRDRVRSAAEELCVRSTFLKVYGAPYATLRDTADHYQADTVVVGASQKTGHRFVGSIATKLVHAGRWPVLVVH